MSDTATTALATQEMVTILVENAYSDGHESSFEREVPAPHGPADLDPADYLVESWWDRVTYDHTGDGHGIDSDLGSCYTVTIVRAKDESIVGASHEWTD